MTAALERQLSVARSARRGGWHWALVGVAALLAANGALYLAAPALFSVDLAKAPYTEANNLELTRVYTRAIPLYQQIIERFPESEYAVLAQIGIANSNKGLGRLATAREQYSTLLSTLRQGPDFVRDRYVILTSLAALYRDSSDVKGFREVFATLEQEYPTSAAVREGRVYLDTIGATSEVTSAVPADFPFKMTADDISLPPRTKVGEEIEVRLAVAPNGKSTAMFSLMTNLDFWQGFKVSQITPTPRSVSDFWGRRAWQFTGIDKPLEIIATLQATAAGDYSFDVDLEQNYEITELGIVKAIEVED